MAVIGKLLRRRVREIAVLLPLFVVALVFGSPAGAQEDDSGLDISFESIALADSAEPTPQVSSLISAGGVNRYVAFDAAELMDDLQNAEQVNLELFNGLRYSLSVTNSGDGVMGSRYWTASNADVVANFTEMNGILEGRLVDNSTSLLYRIVNADGAVHLITEDIVNYPPELGIATPEAPAGTDTNSSSVGAAGDVTANAGPQVDVLAWYDDSAISFWGSEAAAEAAITAAYNNFNTAADSSGAVVTLNMVELKSTSWNAPANSSNALSAIRSQSDGILDDIHAARDAAGADLVAVIGDLIGGCGIAYVPRTPPTSARADLGFSYTDPACVGGNLTLVHETAHNFGASHDIGASQPGPGLFAYSQGYVNPAVGYRTIMSYTTACAGCPRVPFFSNPNAQYQGNPTGDPGKDNARTLTETAAGIASYRSPVETGPGSIGGLISDEDGSPRSGIAVDLFTQAADGTRAEYLTSTTSGNDGRFNFADVEDGCYVATFIAGSGETFTDSGRQWLSTPTCIEPGESQTDINATISQPTQTESFFTGAITYNDGSPAEGVDTVLYQANADGSRGTYLGSELTGADGSYSHSVDPGCFVIDFVAPTGASFPRGQYLQLAGCVQAGQTASGFDGVLTQANQSAAIGGSVTQADGSAAPGIQVDLFETAADGSRGQYLRSVETTADGGYSFDVAPACHTVTFIAYSGETFTNGSQYLKSTHCPEAGETISDANAKLT